MTPQDFAVEFDVSRETLERLGAFEAILRQWSRRINLVGRRTLDDLWLRHMADSAQLTDLMPLPPSLWVDMGSGAGFPGLVGAAILAERAPACEVVLIESDARKCAFLNAAAAAMGLRVIVETARLEAATPRAADIVSARALAPLDTLLRLAWRFRGPGGRCLFPKGRTVESELTEARRNWHIEVRLLASRTDPSGRIVEVLDYHPRN